MTGRNELSANSPICQENSPARRKRLSRNDLTEFWRRLWTYQPFLVLPAEQKAVALYLLTALNQPEAPPLRIPVKRLAERVGLTPSDAQTAIRAVARALCWRLDRNTFSIEPDEEALGASQLPPPLGVTETTDYDDASPLAHRKSLADKGLTATKRDPDEARPQKQLLLAAVYGDPEMASELEKRRAATRRPMTAEYFFAAFQRIAKIKRLTVPRTLTKERKEKILARLRHRQWMRDFADGVRMLPLPGPGWQPTLDWIISNNTNVSKLAEGAYNWRAKHSGDGRAELPLPAPTQEMVDRIRRASRRRAKPAGSNQG